MNEVTACYKGACIQTKGDFAEMMVKALALMFVLYGIAAIIKAIR